MDFYLDIFLDANELNTSLGNAKTVANYKVAIVSLALPKTFDNTIEYLKLLANFVTPQMGGKKLLFTSAVHDTDRSKSLICEPVNLQYRNVCSDVIQGLSFNLLDEQDRPIHFDSGKVMLVLHFVAVV
jgi:hypothetical protein